nr:reverse transcriptase domain-containing protein [Tanacetum cinerariifolium]
MSLLFADTHNVVAILEKSDAAEGFEQIIDFLSGSYIHYALTVSPHIYISCIKQFWNSVLVKRSGDVTRLQALVDKKKISREIGILSFLGAYFIALREDTQHLSMGDFGNGYSRNGQKPGEKRQNQTQNGKDRKRRKTVLEAETAPMALKNRMVIPTHLIEHGTNIEVDPFTPRIYNFKSSRKTRMPNNVKTYDGTRDIEDHVKIFQAATQVERWAMPTWCHMFNSTLIGTARIWRDRDQQKTRKKDAPVKDKAATIYMIQPWQRVMRHKVTQSFAHIKEIMFLSLAANKGTGGPLVIETKISGHTVHRIYVDGGSLMEVLYERCFNRLQPEIKSQMVSATTSLTGFSGETIWPLGQLRLLVTIGDAEHYTRAWMSFMIVRSPSPYNDIIGRPGIREIQAQLEIVKLKARVKKLEKINMVKSSKLRRLKKVGTSQRVESSNDIENVFNQGRIIADMDQDERIELVADQEKDAEVEGRHAEQAELYNLDQDHSSKVLSMQEDDTEAQEAIEIVNTAKLMTEVVTAAAATQAVAASTHIPTAEPTILNIVAAPAVSTKRRKGVVIRDPEEELPSDTPAETPRVKDKGKEILIEAPKPMKKKDQIEMDAEYARKLQEEINKEHEETYKNIDWNAALDHVQSKEPQYIKRYHGMKKKPQTESEARKNTIFYLKNTEGYKMDFLKGMKYDEILPIFQAKFDANMRFLFKSREEMEEEDEEIIKSINETPAQKAAKRRKLSEEAQEAEDLRKQLKVVEDEDDDVFVEATPLAQKNFDREDLETLWRIVRDRFFTSKPTNFSDEYLLLTLKTMFEEPDGQDAIWTNKKSVHGLALVKRWKLLTSWGVHVTTLSTVQLFLLVKRRYPLSRFTLEQLVNVTRLQVEEESEMSLELLRFTRQQLQEYQQG